MRFLGIDPATKTGVVALNEKGEVVLEVELKGAGKAEKGGITIAQLVDLENQLYQVIQPGDETVIEQAAAGTQKGITTGMIHGGLRSIIHRKGLVYHEINPLQTKKYVGVTGWKGEAGSKVRLKDKEKKEAVSKAVLKMFGYQHKSDNVVDAYIIARAAWNLYLLREYKQLIDSHPFQIEIIQGILDKAK
jgi:crossover junction endodeoxyribonuclease RuvC